MISSSIQQVMDFYKWSMSISDPRTSKWFLMSSPGPLLAIIACYMAMLVIGPKLMKNRQAFDLKPVLFVYNLSLVLLSLYMLCEHLLAPLAIPGFNWLCQGVEYSDDPRHVRLANVSWLYFFSKIIELVETLFFILRKKNNQVSFLHVYHHVTMSCLWWIVVKWAAGGTSYIGASLNCFVHVVMYTYYMLSIFGPTFQKYLWWKKYLTSLQLVQFFALVVFIPLSVRVPHCTFPSWISLTFLGYSITLIMLFGNFYIQQYLKKSKKA